jgi:hypothetical protein
MLPRLHPVPQQYLLPSLRHRVYPSEQHLHGKATVPSGYLSGLLREWQVSDLRLWHAAAKRSMCGLPHCLLLQWDCLQEVSHKLRGVRGQRMLEMPLGLRSAQLPGLPQPDLPAHAAVLLLCSVLPAVHRASAVGLPDLPLWVLPERWILSGLPLEL